jgi:hypothetical protein
VIIHLIAPVAQTRHRRALQEALGQVQALIP